MLLPSFFGYIFICNSPVSPCPPALVYIWCCKCCILYYCHGYIEKPYQGGFDSGRAEHFIECNRKHADERNAKKVQYHDHYGWFIDCCCWWANARDREPFHSQWNCILKKSMHGINEMLRLDFLLLLLLLFVSKVLFSLTVGCNSSFANFIWFEFAF